MKAQGVEHVDRLDARINEQLVQAAVHPTAELLGQGFGLGRFWIVDTHEFGRGVVATSRQVGPVRGHHSHARGPKLAEYAFAFDQVAREAGVQSSAQVWQASSQSREQEEDPSRAEELTW